MNNCLALSPEPNSRILQVPYYTLNNTIFHPARALSMASVTMTLTYLGMHTLMDHVILGEVIEKYNRPAKEWIISGVKGCRKFLADVVDVVKTLRSVSTREIPEPKIIFENTTGITGYIDSGVPVLLSGIGQVIPGAWRTKLLHHLVVAVGYGYEDGHLYLLVNDPQGDPTDGYLSPSGRNVKIFIDKESRLSGIAFVREA